MTALGRRVAALALAFAFALPSGSAEADGARHHDNVATAVTDSDGAHVADFAWGISRQRGGVVDQLNVAHASARCTDCGATAIAFQIVLVSGRPSSQTPRNLAVAINDQCTRCVVAAVARQFIAVYDSPVRFTGPGVAELAGVRQELQALASEDVVSAGDLQAAVEREEARVLAVLQNDVVLKSEPGTEADALSARVLQDRDQD